MAHDVFISHSTQDKVVADAVCAALEAEKIRCWIAPRDIKPGKNWAEAITDALKTSKLMVLIFSDHSNQSKQVANELTLAVNAKAVVVPFKIEEIPPSKVMEFYLTGAHWLDAMNPPTETQISELVKLVKKALGGEPDEVGIFGQKEIAPEKIPAKSEGKLTRTPLSVMKKVGLAAAALLLGGLLIYGGSNFFAGIDSQEDTGESEADSGVFIPPEIGTIIVTTTEDSGQDSLRGALHQAKPEDVITFDPSVFPPDNPAIIYIESPLPSLNRGGVIINASNAGVIIDGSKGESSDGFYGISIMSSDNIIMGLQIVNCWGYAPEYDDYAAGAAILITGMRASNNIIGGDRSIGNGPSGQGNILAGNAIGIDLQSDAHGNIIAGNLIGTDTSGKNPNRHYGNEMGMVIDQRANKNFIGPDNIIAFNTHAINMGQPEGDLGVISNTLSANSIHSNSQPISINGGANNSIAPPRLISVNLAAGTVRGSSSPGCTVEIFSDRGNQGEIFEGRVQADENGNFVFEAGKRLTGPNITATATDEDGSTSEFSSPAGQSQ